MMLKRAPVFLRAYHPGDSDDGLVVMDAAFIEIGYERRHIPMPAASRMYELGKISDIRRLTIARHCVTLPSGSAQRPSPADLARPRIGPFVFLAPCLFLGRRLPLARLRCGLRGRDCDLFAAFRGQLLGSRLAASFAHFAEEFLCFRVNHGGNSSTYLARQGCGKHTRVWKSRVFIFLTLSRQGAINRTGWASALTLNQP